MDKERISILVIEDDATIVSPLVSGLQDMGVSVLHTDDGHQGLDLARSARPALVLLGVALPKMNGFAVCRTLRQESAVPIIMVSKCGHERERIKGLEYGADAYLAKPIGVRELLSWVQALLRRRDLDRNQASTPDDRIVAHDIVLDRKAQQVWREGRLIDLRRLEFRLLATLMQGVGQALSRHVLLDRVWGEDWVGDPRTLDVHIRWLRQKIEDNPSVPHYIQTVHGIGYRFVDPSGLLA